MEQARAGRPSRRARRSETGVTTVVVVVALTALIGAAALGIDVGLAWSARTQLQNAVDASALAAAGTMVDAEALAGPIVDLPTAQTAATNLASQNQAVANSSVNVEVGDLTFGFWDLDAEALLTPPDVDLGVPEQVTGVEVLARLDGASNNRVPTVMARLLGRDSFSVEARAIGYRGFAGQAGLGDVDLPIAIDCCALRGSNCDGNYCATISSPPNPCTLEENPQSIDFGGGGNPIPVTCIAFDPTPGQNACWTLYDDASPSVNASDLVDYVEAGGNAGTVETEMDVFVDNGGKVPVIRTIRDRFQNEGVDRYEPIEDPPDPDSWAVILPVVECQTDTHCAGGSTAEIIGFVCFEIREVEGPPDKKIRGRFLCPSDPDPDIRALYQQECQLPGAGPGGDYFGIFAQFPVLVR